MTRLTDLGLAVSCFAGHGDFWKTHVLFPAQIVTKDAFRTGNA